MTHITNSFVSLLKITVIYFSGSEKTVTDNSAFMKAVGEKYSRSKNKLELEAP